MSRNSSCPDGVKVTALWRTGGMAVGVLCWTTIALVGSASGSAQPARSGDESQAPAAAGSSPLRRLDVALKELTAKVSPAVVQVLTTGYAPEGRDSSNQTAVFARQQSVGSGVILDPSGYIVTNAHVVKGAERVEVVLTKRSWNPEAPLPPVSDQVLLPATVLGLTEYFDLALLKVEATGLPTLELADFRDVTQGQLVLAVGSPLGLDNSVTMGVISAVARQAKPDSAVEFVQTDAPINPGSSGGALVDVEGRLVGINTFILSQSGGSQGLGFALPAPIVSLAYQSLRQKGHVDRRIIGVGIQAITPTLAKGLGLPRAFGLLVCDPLPGGPGEKAGLQIGDVLVEADGRPISTPSQLDGSLYTHDIAQPFRVTVLRQGARVPLELHVVEEPHPVDSLIDPADTEKNLVRTLGVIAATVTPELEERLGGLRIHSGVAIVARTAEISGVDLLPGDVIHAVKSTPTPDVAELREQMTRFQRGDAVVLLVERRNGLSFVAFEMN